MSCQLRICAAAHASTSPARPAPALMAPTPWGPRPRAPLHPTVSPRAPLHLTVSPRCIRAAVSIKIKDYGGLGDFELAAEQREALEAYLVQPAFCDQVRANVGWPEGARARFSGQLFQPVPWSASTRRGMPAAMEAFADSPDHAIINVPPLFMFKAKVFSPSRLCAVYERLTDAAAAAAAEMS